MTQLHPLMIFTFDDVKFENYVSHPPIAALISV